jgi:type VI secretion system protein ImpF
MPRSDADPLVTQSVLDRLIDKEPLNSADPSITRAQTVRLLKGALRRDLEWLLNTRRIADRLEAEHVELASSVYHYGLPDVTALSFASPKDRVKLLRSLESTIRAFEPRLMNVKVIPVDNSETGSRQILRFQVEGLLKMDPAPEQISFDTVLQLSSGEYQVKGDRSA